MVMTEEARIEKNKKIAETYAATRERHANMKCLTYELKIDMSKCDDDQERSLYMVFIESKWVYNYGLTYLNEFGKLPYLKSKDPVTVRLGRDSDVYEKRTTTYLGSQVKNGVISKASDALSSLKTLKDNGHKVGALKFAKEINSITFNQYGVGFDIDKQRSTIRLQKLGEFKVHGMKQIPKDCEIAVLTLVQRASGFYAMVTVYVTPKPKGQGSKRQYRDHDDLRNQKTRVLTDAEAQRFLGPIGIDMGVKDHITTSKSETFNVLVSETPRLKGLQRKLAKQEKGSNRYIKTKKEIGKEYEKMGNIKNERARRIAQYLLQYDTVYFQDELISGWKRLFGKQIHHSILGRVKKHLKEHSKTLMLSSSVPTTQTCQVCFALTKIPLSQREFICQYCGYRKPRDLHSSELMVILGQDDALLVKKSEVPAVDDSSKRCGDATDTPHESSIPVEDTCDRSDADSIPARARAASEKPRP